MRFTVLWTKQVRKKVKTYHDGFVTVSGSRHAKLLDADGVQVLCSTTLPRSQQLAPDVDGIDCFEGFLVNCLEACCQHETQDVDGSQADSGAARLCQPAACEDEGCRVAQPQRGGLQVMQAAARSIRVPQLKRKHDAGFSAPRPITVPEPAEHADLVPRRAAPCMQQPKRLQQCVQQPASLLQQPQHQQVQQHSGSQVTEAAKRQRRRSDDDILQAFGLAPACAQQVSSRQQAAPAAAAVHAMPAGTCSVGKPPAAAAPLRQAAPGSGSPQNEAAAPPAQKQSLWRPALATMRPHSLSSVDWSDEEEPAVQGAGVPAAPAEGQATKLLLPQALPPSPALTDTTNEHAEARPPQQLQLPPPGRKAAPAARPQQGPAFAAPRMQAPRPAAHPGAGVTAGCAAAGTSGVPSSAAACRPLRPVVAPPVSQAGSVVFSSPGQERRRGVMVPDSFQSLQQYKHTWTAALMEEASLRFAETAGRFHQALQRVSPSAQVGHPPRSPQELQSSLRRSGLQYYADARLVMYKESSGSKFGSNKSRGQEVSSSSGKKHTYYLELLSGRERSTAYRKGDLWVISNNAQLAGAAGPGSTNYTVVVQSSWHGPNADGRMEVILLGPRPPGLTRSQPVFSLHGPNAATELGAAALLQAAQGGDAPVLTSLLAAKARSALQPASTTAGSAGSCLGEAALSTAVRAAAQRHQLNPEQAAVLAQVEAWSGSAASQDTSGIVLVHGPFGSGKTMLLVALILFLRSLMPGTPACCRILVAAHTNSAVDRILLGLAAHGFTDFLRVGSLPRINKEVLPYSLHADARARKGGAAAELKDMLVHAASPYEASIIRTELSAVEAGAEAKRKRRLKTVGVVGSTCCAALVAEALQGIRFDVVVLDEAAQVVEPLALAPILRSGCRFLVAAGDPCQLPPLVAAPQAVSCSSTGSGHSSSNTGGHKGFGRSLFKRLVAAGVPAHLLRRQYRCHPDIAAVPNSCFYGGRLLDGVSAADRPPLLPGCPPLVVLDVRGSEVYDASRSASNPAEAQAVRRLVRQLADQGVPRSEIGIISFFHAQVRCIQATLGDLISSACGDGDQEPAEPEDAVHQEVQVATVDSFQGMEKAVIILSTAVTRTGAFASDARRLNVALSRAKQHLFIVGAAPTLQQSGPALQRAISGCRATANAFWPDGRLLLPPPAAMSGTAAVVAQPTPLDAATEQPPAAAALTVGPSDSRGTRGMALQMHCNGTARFSPPAAAAVHSPQAVHTAEACDAEDEGQLSAAATHGGMAVADDDPDVPCFDLGI